MRSLSRERRRLSEFSAAAPLREIELFCSIAANYRHPHTNLVVAIRTKSQRRSIFVFNSPYHELVGNWTTCHEKFSLFDHLDGRFPEIAKSLIFKLKENALSARSLCRQQGQKSLWPVAEKNSAGGMVNALLTFNRIRRDVQDTAYQARRAHLAGPDVHDRQWRNGGFECSGNQASCLSQA